MTSYTSQPHYLAIDHNRIPHTVFAGAQRFTVHHKSRSVGRRHQLRKIACLHGKFYTQLYILTFLYVTQIQLQTLYP